MSATTIGGGSGVSASSSSSVVAPPPPTIEIDAGDIIALMLQFCREQGLCTSFKTLQEESGVALNILENRDAFAADVLAGRWSAVLPVVSMLKLPAPVLTALYEQIVCELLETREGEAAKALLRGAHPCLLLKQENPQRFLKLDQLASRGHYDSSEIYTDRIPKEKRRAEILRSIVEHTRTAPPSRLVLLLTQAIKWQYSLTGGGMGGGGSSEEGTMATTVDLLLGESKRSSSAVSSSSSSLGGSSSSLQQQQLQQQHRIEDEYICRTFTGMIIKFGTAAKPEAALFTRDGLSLITGSVDGILEVYDANTGKLRTTEPFAYQARDEFMMHDDAILCLAISSLDAGDGRAFISAESQQQQLLASGGRDGKLKVWRLASGECIRKFNSAHGEGNYVNCVAFSPDGSQVLSGGGDGIGKIFGLRSGNCIKQFRGHDGSITCCGWVTPGGGGGGGVVTPAVSVTGGGLFAYTGSLDGTVRVWYMKTGDCVATLRPPQVIQTADAAIVAVFPHTPRTSSSFSSSSDDIQLLVVSRSPSAHLMSVGSDSISSSSSSSSSSGKNTNVLKSYTHNKPPGTADFVAAELSPSGKWLYLAGEDGAVYVFNVATAELEYSSFPSRTSSAAAVAGGSNSSSSLKPMHERGITGLLSHPYKNRLATWSDDGTLKLWQP